MFNPGASAFTITVSASSTANTTLTISGVGISNNSGIAQNFVTAVNGIGNFGTIAFTNSATAGSGTVFTNNGSTGGRSGTIQFLNTSTAGNGTFTNNGATASGAGSVIIAGGTTGFSGTSSAANGTFTNNGAAVIKVVEKQETTPADFSVAKDKFREEVLADRRNRFFGAYMVKAKQRMKIEVNRETLQKAVS